MTKDETQEQAAESSPGFVLSRGPEVVPAPSPTWLSPGDRVARYTVVELLGHGGMGAVYRARDTLLGRDVALKVLLAGDRGTAAAQERAARLMREARAAAAIEHPNAAAIFDVGEHEGAPYIAMELVTGCTLDRAVERDAPALATRIGWLADIAGALASAHRRGIVHRDVKPANVMVRDDGIVKVLDFGIACAVESSAPDAHAPTALELPKLTREGGVVGTPAYMAPEQLHGETVDARADQFAWGVLAYELIAGVRPWPARDAVAYVAQLLHDPPPPLVAPHGPLSRGVQTAVARALGKQPGDRFTSMDALIEALTAADPVPSTSPRRGGWLGRACVVAAALVLVAASLLPARAPRAPARRSGDAPAAPPRDRAAREAYDAAVVALHEGSLNEARRAFARATAIDRTFAAAHLRRAMLSSEPDTAMRTHVQAAQQFRSALDGHERALLFGLEPLTRVPADWNEADRRLVAAAAQFPESAEAPFVLGRMRWARVGEYEGAIEAFTEALRREPLFAAASGMIGLVALYAGDVPAMRRAFDVCLERSPASTLCLNAMAIVAENEGECEVELTLARRLVAFGEPSGHQLLANASYALGDEAAAWRALEAHWGALPEGARRTAELGARANLAAHRGDFEAADGYARAWVAAVDASPDEWDHFDAYRLRVSLALEMGRRADAAAIADEYLRRQPAWTPDESMWDSSIHFIETKYRAGAIDHASLDRLRRAWLDKEHARAARTGRTERGTWWIAAYARPVVTAEDGREALAALPEYLPLQNALNRGLNAEEPIGEAYRLAGHLDEALASLRLAASSCDALEAPLYAVWARFHLGEVLEALGDPRGACAAYAGVIQRWGGAKPASSTAAAARLRAAALACR